MANNSNSSNTPKGSEFSAEQPELAQARISALVASLGEPAHIDEDPEDPNGVRIYAFPRNFIEEGDHDAEDDDGYVLVTTGMSDQLMEPPEDFEGEESLAIELIWYVRDLNPEYFANLRWLAKFPFIDGTWLGFGHTIPMPWAPLTFCEFKTFLLLPPIVGTDAELFGGLERAGHPIETFVVHVISDAEYGLIQGDEGGLDEFFDLLDDSDYPLIFDPARASIV